jgi:hypothetical protein
VLVAEDLDLDMAGVLDELLDEDAIVAEARLGLGAGKRIALLRLLGAVGNAHTLAAAAGRGLDHDGIADLVGDLHGLLGVGDLAEVPGTVETLALAAAFLLSILSPMAAMAGVGADEDDAGLLSATGKASRSDRKP